MNHFDALATHVGDWRGTSVLQDPHFNIAEESPSTARLSAIPDGVFDLEYSWSYKGKPQSGLMQIRCDGAEVSLSWTDTWHTGNAPMACSGPVPIGSTISVRGSYEAVYLRA